MLSHVVFVAELESDNESEPDEEEEEEVFEEVPIQEATKKQSTKKVQKKKPEQKRVWSSAEKKLLNSKFDKEIRLGKIPGKNIIVTAQRESPLLAAIPWSKIKFAVYNIIKSRKNLKC